MRLPPFSNTSKKRIHAITTDTYWAILYRTAHHKNGGTAPNRRAIASNFLVGSKPIAMGFVGAVRELPDVTGASRCALRTILPSHEPMANFEVITL
jgi:hypothetical protein